jgi:DNA repair exonuclease SbcCD ATPase subunit
MIRRLHIEGWRAFERLTLELDDGVTFVVAENGIGKTSLIEAASWGVYGPLAGIDARAASRFGGNDVRVELDLELPGGQLLRMQRSLKRGAAKLDARLDGAVVEETELTSVMEDAFGATPEFLSRTTLLPSAAVSDDSAGVFQLHAHLCHVFGVDDLRHAADLLRRTQGLAEGEAKRHRQQARHVDEDLGRLRSELADLDQATQLALDARRETRDAVDAAQRRLSEAREIEATRALAEADLRSLEELLTDARATLGISLSSHEVPILPPTIENLASQAIGLRRDLEEAEALATRRTDDQRAELAKIAAQLSVARDGLAELHSAAGECPVCRRDLEPEDREAAQRRHDRDIARLLARQRTIQSDLETSAQALQSSRALASRAARLRFPDPLPSDTKASGPDIDVDDAVDQLESLRAIDEERLNHLAELRAARTAVEQRVQAEEALEAEQQQSFAAHRREAAASIAAKAMTATADAILTERIDPLVAEISHRWKRVFVNRGELKLRHDGRLVLIRGAHEIGFEQLSSGEKVIALLATRMLVLSSSTRASFLWLDEPLEHLDPSNRRLAASLMANAGAHIKQLLVTTYEEQLARQLARTETAAIRFVKAANRD